MIANKLDREDVKSLRVVNLEFYTALSGYFLKQLVIHVDSELCATLNTGASSAIDSTTSGVAKRLIDSGRLLRNFGDQIRRFGLALELTESQLVSPTVPSDEVIEVRPWGMYRWPAPTKSAEKTTLGAITDSLDNSEGLSGILAHLGQVQELGLSCEGGLGYIRGPDVTVPSRLPAVFGDGKTVSEVPRQLDFDRPYVLEKLDQMIRRSNLSQAESELAKEFLRQGGMSLEELSDEQRVRCLLPVREREKEVSRDIKPSRLCCQARFKTLRLQPDMLTQSQKLFLFEHIEVQQALLQSYVFGLMDNASSFERLRALKIASLPSHHMGALFHPNFWANLSMLEEVSLAVVPDWRTIKRHEAHLEDTQVYPADAIPKVFCLFNDHIGKQRNIKHVHFEWLCGGELAPGKTQRNKHVLPAPFMKNHRKIVDSRLENLLILPHVTHLSLKNCWFTPHVFYRIIHEMGSKSLVSLELTTVSLSGAPHRQPLLEGQNQPNAVGPPPPRVLQPNAAYAPKTLSWGHIIDMLLPRHMMTIAQYMAQGNNDMVRIRQAMEKNPSRYRYPKLKLKRLAFTSCGYVEVPDYRFIAAWPFKEDRPTRVEPSSRRPVHDNTCCCVEHFMQASSDRHLARVIRGMPAREAQTLHLVHGFEFGWRVKIPRTGLGRRSIINAYAAGATGAAYRYIAFDAAEYEAADRDCPHPAPGSGRFTGLIEDDRPDYEPTPAERYEGIFYPKEEKKQDTGDGMAGIVEVMEYDTSRFDRDYDDVGGESLGRLMNNLEGEAGYVSKEDETGLPGNAAGRRAALLEDI
ncbi:hypothetical protein SLS62_009828 [Diatrype stigma]|uniref:Uncharacterized protein n=1 Tax=Diatrype stigma TaxID=117547 RepID=A0AAN9UJ77_9PEZI